MVQIMNARFEQDFDEQFSDMAEVAKPLSKYELQTAQAFEQGAQDCKRGLPPKERQCEAYNQGYLKESEKWGK